MPKIHVIYTKGDVSTVHPRKLRHHTISEETLYTGLFNSQKKSS